MTDNIATRLFKLLKQHYSHFDFNGSDLNVLTRKDLIEIASLLMHFTAILEPREVFVEPLCSNLPESFQISIKKFLETFQHSKTREDFYDIIESCVKKESCVSPSWVCVSPVTNSPLQKFFKTPTPRFARFLEKDKEIQKLKTELEVERMDKLEVQDDLKMREQQIKKLSTQLKEKSKEVSKIRQDFFDLQNRVPPHDNKDYNQIRKRYESEIKSLEVYIQQLQLEQEELVKERDVLSKKAKKAEAQSHIWEERCVTVEEKFNNLSKKHTVQELELANLQIECNELKAILDELKNLKQNEESFVETETVSKNCENLACALVEADLHNVKKENCDLKQLLNESLDKEIKLNEKVSLFQKQTEHLNLIVVELQTENKLLLSKLSTMKKLQEDFDSISKELFEISNELGMSKDKNAALFEEVQNLNEVISRSGKTCAQLEMLNRNLNNDLDALQEKCEKLEEANAYKDEMFKTLEKQQKVLHNEYAAVVDKYSEASLELEVISKKYIDFEQSIEKALDKLEDFILESNTIHSNNKVDVIEKLLECLKQNKVEDINEKIKLNNTILDMEALLKEVQMEVAVLTKKEAVSLQEKDCLENKVRTLEDQIKKLEENITDYTGKINQLLGTVADLQANIAELEKLKDVIKVLEANNSSLTKDLEENRIDRLNVLEQLKNTKKEVKNLETKEKILNETIEELDNSKLNLETLLGNCKNEIETKRKEQTQTEELMCNKEKKHLEEINVLQNQVMRLKENIATQESDITIIKGELANKIKELDDCKHSHRELTKEYETTKAVLSKKNELVSETLSNIQKQLESETLKKLKIEATLAEQIKMYEAQQVDRATIIQECETLNRNLNNELEKLVAKELEISEKNKTVQMFEEKLSCLKSEIETKNDSIQEMQELVKKQHATIANVENSVVELNQKNVELQNNILQLNNELLLLRELKNTLEVKSEDLERNTAKMIEEYSMKIKEHQGVIDKLNLYKTNTEKKLEVCRIEHENSQKDLEKAIREHQSAISDQNREVKILNETITVLNKTVSQLNAKEIECVRELRITKEELNSTVSKYTVALQSQQELKQEYETHVNDLTENLHDVVEKFNNLEKVHSETIFKLNDSQNSITSLESLKAALELKISEEKIMYDKQFESMQVCLNSEIEQLKSKEILYVNEAEQLNNELSSTKNKNNDLQKEIDDITAKLQQIRAEKVDLLNKQNKLENNYKRIEVDYSSLKLAHENYVEAANNNLETVQHELQTQIKILEEDKRKSLLQQDELREKIKVLREEIVDLKSEHKETFKELCAKIKEYTQKLCDYESRLLKLTNEKNNLEATLNETKAEYNKIVIDSRKNKENLNLLGKKYTALKSANDLLETGKQKLQKEVDDFRKLLSVANEQNYDSKIVFKQDLSGKTTELAYLKEQLTELETNCDVKENAIQMFRNELTMLNSVLENVTSGKQKLIEFMKQENNETKATFENEEYKFNELKTTYEIICNKLFDLKIHNEVLEQQLDEFRKEKNSLQLVLTEKESMISLFNQKKSEEDEHMRQLEIQLTESSELLTKKLASLQDLENEKKNLILDLKQSHAELERLKRNRDEILENQTKIIKETENNILRAHQNAIDVKNDLLRRVELAENEKLNEHETRNRIELMLEEEKKSKAILNVRVLELETEKNKILELYDCLTKNVSRLSCLIQEKPVCGDQFDFSTVESLEAVIIEIETRVTKIFEKKHELSEVIKTLQEDKTQINIALEELKNEKDALNKEKDQLIRDFDEIQKEKGRLLTEKEVTFRSLESKFKHLQERYDEIVEANEELILDKQLQEKLLTMKETNDKAFSLYKELIEKSKFYKNKVNALITTRNSIESLVNNLNQNIASVLIKTVHVTETSHKNLFEQKQSLEIINQDIRKQFFKLTKQTFDLNLSLMSVTEKSMEDILADKPILFEKLFSKLNVDEVSDQLEHCRDRITHTLDQIEAFDNEVTKQNGKPVKSLKENVNSKVTGAQNTDWKQKEEEWKKKNAALKHRLTLADSAKGMFEKKLKQIREENKRLMETRERHVDIDYEKNLAEHKRCYEELQKEFDEYRLGNKKSENNAKVEEELKKIREAYTNVMTENSKLDLENCRLKQQLEDRNAQLIHLNHLKEMYEKLLEENNKLLMELDTIKFKRARDRDEYMRLIKKGKEEVEAKGMLKVRVAQEEYEEKLEKMKEKMVRV